MRRPYQITGAVLLLLAAWIAVEALQLRYYTSLGPGPGFFSFWLAMILGALAVVMLLQATLGQADPAPPDFFASRTGYLRIGAVVLALAGTTALLEPLVFAYWLERLAVETASYRTFARDSHRLRDRLDDVLAVAAAR